MLFRRPALLCFRGFFGLRFWSFSWGLWEWYSNGGLCFCLTNSHEFSWEAYQWGNKMKAFLALWLFTRINWGNTIPVQTIPTTASQNFPAIPYQYTTLPAFSSNMTCTDCQSLASCGLLFVFVCGLIHPLSQGPGHCACKTHTTQWCSNRPKEKNQTIHLGLGNIKSVWLI